MKQTTIKLLSQNFSKGAPEMEVKLDVLADEKFLSSIESETGTSITFNPQVQFKPVSQAQTTRSNIFNQKHKLRLFLL